MAHPVVRGLAVAALALAADATVAAQAAEMTTLWQRSFERETDAWIHDVAIAPGGGYCLVGRRRMQEEDGGSGDAWVLRLDAGGEVVWERTLGGAGDQDASGAVATADGGCVVTGGTGKYIGDAWIFRLDRRGEMVWEHLIGGPHSESIGPIAATPDGGFVALGSTWDPHDRWFNRDSNWLARFDADGAMRWQRAPGDPTIGHRYLEDRDDDRQVLRGDDQIAVLENGHVLIAGPFSLSGAKLGYAGIELDDSGSVAWSETLGPGWPHAFTATPEVGYVIGYFEDVPGSSPRAELIRFDTSGRELWRTQADLFDDAPPPSAFPTRHGTLSLFSDGSLTMVVERHFRIVGQENPTSRGDLWLLQFDADGKLTVRERLPSQRELARTWVSAALVDDESLVLVGKTVWGRAGGERGADVWLRRISLP